MDQQCHYSCGPLEISMQSPAAIRWVDWWISCYNLKCWYRLWPCLKFSCYILIILFCYVQCLMSFVEYNIQTKLMSAGQSGQDKQFVGTLTFNTLSQLAAASVLIDLLTHQQNSRCVYHSVFWVMCQLHSCMQRNSMHKMNKELLEPQVTIGPQNVVIWEWKQNEMCTSSWKDKT